MDDAVSPAVAYLHLDFRFLVGDHRKDAALRMVRDLPDRTAIQADAGWEGLLRSRWGDRLVEYTRTAYTGADWNRDRLVSQTRSLPDGYRLFRVTRADVQQYAAFDDSLVKNFRDLSHFLEVGVGFGIRHEGEIVAGCSSYTQADDQVEIEIDTRKDHRRRGLALATGAALILHCLEHGLQPCWDAANEGSKCLAERLGFTEPVRYTAWYTS